MEFLLKLDAGRLEQDRDRQPDDDHAERERTVKQPLETDLDHFVETFEEAGYDTKVFDPDETATL